ncbi:MAG: nicotinate (nicotinamide) nucleotide adenylyltransferase [Planctomycetota bacterium]|jgi:nicotinate-nucleotide adenylyltransferase
MKKTKIILFGGSFDPVHSGHLQVAQAVFAQLAADTMIFIPARQSPLKKDQPVEGRHRLEMLRLAVAGNTNFSTSDCELMRPIPSYTLQTIEHFQKKFGRDVQLHWLIGADQLDDFDKWYRVTDLLNACQVTVMYRAGYPKPTFDRFAGTFTSEQIRLLSDYVVATPLVPISSTAIRRHLAEGTLPKGWLPDAVYGYIKQYHLYGC